MANFIIIVQIIGAIYESITRNNLKFEGKKPNFLSSKPKYPQLAENEAPTITCGEQACN